MPRMSILRARFASTLGLHKKGETYLVNDEEFRTALAAGALDVETVELVKHADGGLSDEQVLALVAPPAEAPPDPPPEGEGEA